MVDPEVGAKLDEVKAELDAIYTSVERTRKYFMWTLIVSVVLFVLPLLGLLFALPSFLTGYGTALQPSGLEDLY